MSIPRPLVTHIGHGDNIVQIGLTRVLAERFGPIAFPCYERYETSCKSFFVDDPLISVYTLPHQDGWDWGSPPDWVWNQRIKECGMEGQEHLRAGNYAGVGTGWDFTQSFYQHLNVPYEARWERGDIWEAATRVEQLPVVFPSEPKIFLHDDPMRLFNGKPMMITRYVDRNKAFLPDFSFWTQSILRYIKLILAADEIHVIDSVFFHLINSLPFVMGKLFLHGYPRWPRSISFRYPTRLNWEYIF